MPTPSQSSTYLVFIKKFSKQTTIFLLTDFLINSGPLIKYRYIRKVVVLLNNYHEEGDFWWFLQMRSIPDHFEVCGFFEILISLLDFSKINS